uniref:Uncharacterized protein n=1 Tax=Moniliophthora roreri TaxID=221103 RepID=A0A0W0G3N2_MONRR
MEDSSEASSVDLFVTDVVLTGRIRIANQQVWNPAKRSRMFTSSSCSCVAGGYHSRIPYPGPTRTFRFFSLDVSLKIMIV